jgi:nicotinic acid mononucleotide adenylyltransferase
MHTWRCPHLILSNCNLIVAARPGHGLSNESLAYLLGMTLESGPAAQPGPSLSSGGLDRLLSIIDLTGDRKATAAKLQRHEAGSIFLTDYISIDVSSTVIRHRAAQNLDIRGMVPQGVAEYIEKYELYKAGQPAGIQ